MRERMTLSFEVFPPKTDKGMENLPRVIGQLAEFRPDYISCTYGAGGSNLGPNRRVLQEIARIVPPCTHFTCISLTKKHIREQLQQYLDDGVEHILALRGDYPRGWTNTGGDFQHATELVQFIREEFGDRFEIAVAAAPGGHVECISEDDDIAHLKEKQDLGADYIITQLCYDLEQFKVWRDKVDKAGITMPIDVGLMPVTTKHGVLTQCFSRNACAVPRDLALVMTHHWFQKDPNGNEIPEVKAAFREEGLTYSADLLNRYLSLGINGIHLYALNRADDVSQVLQRSGFAERFQALL